MDFSRLTAFLDRLPEMGIPGTDCIVYQNHKQIYRHSSGYADVKQRRRRTPDTLYHIYSASKVITCAAALQLYEKGAFLLGDRLSDYIPEYKDMAVRQATKDGKAEIVPAKNPILIRDLFTMTAGYDYNTQTQEIKTAVQETGGRADTLAVVKAMARTPLLFEPSTRWCYGLSHDILGGLIEVVSGQKFGDYLKEHIFEPLGMQQTGFDETPEILERMACQYEYKDEMKTAVEIPKRNTMSLGSAYQSGGAGLISRPDDYILFIDAMCSGGVGANGERILSKATIDLMRTNQLCAEARKAFSWDALAGYGYGLGVRTMVDKVAGGSNGSLGEFGWSGAAGAYVLIDPDRNLGLYYSQHMINNKEPYIHPRIRNILYSCL